MGSCRSAPWSTAAESKQTTTLQIDSLIMVAPKSVRLAIVAERGRAIGPTPPLRCVLGVDRRRVETLTAVDRGPSLVARHSYLDRAETAFAMTVPGHETNLIDSAISAATPLRAQPGGVGADGVRRRMTAPRSVQGFILGDSGQLDYRRASIGSSQSLDVDVDEAVVRWPKRGRARRRCRAVECPWRSPGDHRCRSVVAYLRRPGFLGEERDRVAAPFSGIGAHLHGERRTLLGACRNDDGGRPGDRPGRPPVARSWKVVSAAPAFRTRTSIVALVPGVAIWLAGVASTATVWGVEESGTCRMNSVPPAVKPVVSTTKA